MLKAYKYVDEEHAEAIAQGILKIGSLRGYADLEGSRADALEGIVSRKNDHMVVAGLQADARGRRFGDMLPFKMTGGGSLIVTGGTFEHAIPDCYCLCFCRDPANPRLLGERTQAIFEISDLHGLARAVTAQLQGKLGRFRCGRVRYEPRHVHADHDLESMPSAFMKDPAYEDERELRIVWPAPADGSMEPLFTAPDNRIARFLTRISPPRG